MAYSTLRAAIQAAIKQNDNEEITGNLLQSVLLSIVNTVGAGYNFAGVATPSTNPGTPDGAMFWIGGKGTYANFGSSVTIAAGYLGIFMWDGSAFTRSVIKLSGGEGVFDVTDYTGNEYANLSAALAAIPQVAKAGGMEIRYVQSSDHKYVQYLYVGTSTAVADFTNVDNWEKINLEQELNLLGQKIGAYQMPLTEGYYKIAEIGSTMTFDIQSHGNYRCAKIDCSQGDIFFVSGTEQVASVTAPYAFTDANGKVLTRFYGSAVTNGYAKAPSGAVYFVFSATKATAMLYYYPFKSAMAQAVYNILENSYFECSTAASSASKNIVIDGFQNFPITFDAGFHLLVKFTNNNTANNVIFKDDKPLYFNGKRASATNTWNAGDILEMFNDGVNWYAKEATGKEFHSAIESLEQLQKYEYIEELELSTSGGVYVIGDVNTVVDLTNIDTSNNKGVDFIHSSYDCKENDVFIFTGYSKNPTVVLYAVLDKNNKILFRGEAGRSYSYAVFYSNAFIRIPKGGVKFICNNYVNKDKKLLFAENKGGLATSYSNKCKIGFEHIHLENTTSDIVQYVFPTNGLYYPVEGGDVLLKVNSGNNNYNLYGHFLNNGTYRIQQITTLTTGLVYRYASTENETLIGISFRITIDSSPFEDIVLDIDIYKNNSYALAYTLTQKANKPSEFSESHIAIFDAVGNPVDSGYDINNLPQGGGIPSGGNNGEVLATDGDGNYYWKTVPSVVVTDTSQLYGVLVDQYENLNVGVSSVNSIKKAIEVAGEGGTVIFTPNKTYNIDDTISPLNDQIFIGNGATLKRMNESSASVAVAIESSTTNDVTLASVPSNWKVGDTLLFYDSAQGLLGNYIAYANIAAINGNTITVTGKSANPWSLQTGTKVTKSVVMLSGVQYPNPIGFKVYNLVFDGNKEHNSSLLNWYIHGTIRSFGRNTVISDCKFYNIPTENIITQGAMIRNNYAQDLNGSFVHLSCPSENLLNGNERYMGTTIIGNICNRVCCVDNSIMKHSEATITYSWNAGKLTVIGNQFYGNGQSMCIQMNVNVPSEPESSSEVSSNGYMAYVGNIFNNFAKIGEIPDNPYIYTTNKNRIFSDNIFKDCGTNDMTALYKLHIRFENNLYEGNTIVNTGGNTLMYRIDNTLDSTPSASTLTTDYGDIPDGGQVYITQLQKQYRKITVNNSIVWIDESIQIIS